ncbi:MAG: hypothetical protein NWE92_10610 [Candidatus Bathyarchaeota archaeon]|nr:hypothetical protein [Candidatus Bathyarchaeota archaeon]
MIIKLTVLPYFGEFGGNAAVTGKDVVGWVQWCRLTLICDSTPNHLA